MKFTAAGSCATAAIVQLRPPMHQAAVSSVLSAWWWRYLSDALPLAERSRRMVSRIVMTASAISTSNGCLRVVGPPERCHQRTVAQQGGRRTRE